MAGLNFDSQLKEAESRIKYREQACGKQLWQPFTNTISGSRKILSSTNRDQVLSVMHGEVPFVETGFEDQFGEYSSSFIKTDATLVVKAKIPKFSFNPNCHYWLILANEETKELSVIERVEYEHITETYGFLRNNRFIDDLAEGDIVPRDTVIQKSAAYDDYNNRMDGVNLRTGYISCDKTMEDSVILSKSAAAKLASPLIKVVPIIINDNDILLNWYGDNNTYKVIPDLGEEIKEKFVCILRRENKEESLFTQSFSRLRDIMMSDDKITAEGKIIDINIYCNNPEALAVSPYHGQIKYYYDESMKMHNDIVSTLSQFEKDYKFSYDLSKMYAISKKVLAGIQYIKDRTFSNVYMELVVLEINQIDTGDKLCDRYGGKGVTSYILDDELMPHIDDGLGHLTPLEIIYNSSTCVNRLNPGQLFETSLTHIGCKIIDFIKSQCLDAAQSIELILQYVKSVNPEQGEYMEECFNKMDDEEMIMYLSSIIDSGGIVVSLNPISDSMGIDDISRIYDEFEWINQYRLMSPMVDSVGDIRYVPSRRPIVCGYKYIYRLKQYAEEKFSVTSLSATNIKNQNSRSKANKAYKGLYPKTPIKFGEMETGDLGHLGMEFVVTVLMLYSSSPQARRLTEELLTGDPFDVNIKLDSKSSSRNVEILNVYFKAMGLRLVFEKVKKKLTRPVVKHAIDKYPIQKWEEYKRPILKNISNPIIDNDTGLIVPILKAPIVKYREIDMRNR